MKAVSSKIAPAHSLLEGYIDLINKSYGYFINILSYLLG